MPDSAPSFYPILTVDPNAVEDEEQLGSKPKFWFRHEGRRWLFKEVRPNTGEHWAEKVAAELAVLLQVPAAKVELAECLGRRGCAVQSFITERRREVLVHGNELLAGAVTGYDMTKRFRQSDHTLANIIRAVESVFDLGPSRMEAAEQLCGYLTLDALIGNTDRHHENWGLILTVMAWDKGYRQVMPHVAPSFDHASSLGRELLDEERERRLKEQTVRRYIKKARGGIFGKVSDKHGLSPLEVVLRAREYYPALFLRWWQRLAELDELRMRQIVEQVPLDWMSQTARDFALAALYASRHELLTSQPP
jgi:HipA-like C-terminal domain